jgi:hypothetical protein
MAVRRPFIRGILEQEIRNSWRARFLLLTHRNHHDYSISAEWLGCICRRISRMTEHVAFLMKDLVLLAASVYLLRQDVLRASLSAKGSSEPVAAQLQHV